MPSIAIAGLAANDPVPGTYTQVDFAVGPTAGSGATYEILIIGNKTAAGSATVDSVIYGPDTPSPCASLADAAALFGLHSEAYRMYKRALPIANLAGVPISVICPTESAGANATGTITFVNDATATGFVRVYVADEFVDVGITSGDAIGTIATAVAAAITAKTDWPVTASAALGVVTITAAQKGLRGNWIRYGATIFGTSMGTTVTPAPMSFMTGGTTSDTWTAALATIATKRFYYIISADDGGQSATGLTALLTQVNSQALPLTGIRQAVIAGAVDGTSSKVSTVAIALNAARGGMYYQHLGDVPPAELAALCGAAEAAYEAAFSAGVLNFDGFGLTEQTAPFWRVPAPRASTAGLTRTQIVSMLNNGVSPIATTPKGATYIVSRITTKSQSSGQADYRIRDTHKVRVMDRYADELQSKVRLQMANKVIGNDPRPGEKPPGPSVVTPRLLKAAINKQTREYGEGDLLQNAEDIVAATVALRETSPTTRLTASVPLQPVDVAHQVGLYLAQVA